MISTDRYTGYVLLAALAAMIGSAAIAVPAGLTLSPAEATSSLAAVADRVWLHLAELAFDVLGWLALTCAGLLLASGRAGRFTFLAGGLLAAAGLAGLLHDAGNLAVTQLATRSAEPAVIAATQAVLLTAKWMVNLAGLLWAAGTLVLAASSGMRRSGLLAGVSGLVAVALPWTTGLAGPSPLLEQIGYLLQLPVMGWLGILGWRWSQGQPVEPSSASA